MPEQDAGIFTMKASVQRNNTLAKQRSDIEEDSGRVFGRTSVL